MSSIFLVANIRSLAAAKLLSVSKFESVYLFTTFKEFADLSSPCGSTSHQTLSEKLFHG
jgi:hypothetical protein